MADINLYRFSSKEYHPNSGLVYYLYRYYEPNLQRWLNRDPIGENGGINLYSPVANAPLDYGDSWGQGQAITWIPVGYRGFFSGVVLAAEWLKMALLSGVL
ncbi:MAG TPA: RHS repeat-associated core domain-containing protein [Verrucomicrobiae bacterium]|nr:RHS repeat-associated core domain-containing protein [Verrucomicrobiae bacterium]